MDIYDTINLFKSQKNLKWEYKMEKLGETSGSYQFHNFLGCQIWSVSMF